MKKQINKYLDIILKKQCKIVNADFDKINFKKELWFHDYEWTNKQEDNFTKWLMEYMKKNIEARRTLMTIPSNNKRFLEKFVQQYLLNYGWKTKN